MELSEDIENLLEHPEDYAEEDRDVVIGKFDSATYLMFGKQDGTGRYLFAWEDEIQSEDYVQRAGEPLRKTWERMIEDLRSLSDTGESEEGNM